MADEHLAKSNLFVTNIRGSTARLKNKDDFNDIRFSADVLRGRNCGKVHGSSFRICKEASKHKINKHRQQFSVCHKLLNPSSNLFSLVTSLMVGHDKRNTILDTLALFP